jgi:GDP-L-fucose synthase
MIKGEKPLVVWGDGSAIRDFVYCRDVALAMIFVMANGINQPVNIGSGIGMSIKSLIEKLRLIHPNLEVAWDLSKPTGDSSRVLDMSRLFGYGFKLSVDIDQGLKHTYDWYSKNKSQMMVRYDAFEE